MNRNKQMIQEYLELIPGNYLVQTTRKDCFRITDLIDCEIFTLVIRNGRISCQVFVKSDTLSDRSCE